MHNPIINTRIQNKIYHLKKAVMPLGLIQLTQDILFCRVNSIIQNGFSIDCSLAAFGTHYFDRTLLIGHPPLILD